MRKAFVLPRILLILGAWIGVHISVAAESRLSPHRFTAKVAAAFATAGSGLQVQIVAALELKIVVPGGRIADAYLDNIYAEYRNEPAREREIIANYVRRTVAAILEADEKINPARIVPVIRNRNYLPVANAIQGRPREEKDAIVFDELGEDLVVIYAENRPNDLRFFGVQDLKEAGVERHRLRDLALANLRRTLDDISFRDYGGTYMAMADGVSEASVLLLPELWAQGALNVKGEFVIAVPARDLFLVTGSEDAKGLQGLRAIVSKIQSGPYQISSKLYLYRAGTIREFGK